MPASVDPEAQTVVVVNDDPTQLKLLAGLLRKHVGHVLSCHSVEETLSRLVSPNPPDLIITDLHMPGIDGWRFCRLLRSPEYARFNTTPILVVSATFAGQDPTHITSELGANAFLPLPVDGQVFVSHVKALLEGGIPQASAGVLIVDDSPTVRGILKKAFSAHGYRVRTATTGSEGAALIRHESPEILILDYHLADMLGDSLLEFTRNLDPRPVAIMITTDTNPELAMDWMRKGASAYIRKPFDPEYVIEICEKTRREHCLLQVEERLEQRTQEVQERQTKYQFVFENSPEMISCTDDDGLFCDVNNEWLRGTGFSRNEVIGKDAYLFLTPESAREMREVGQPRLQKDGQLRNFPVQTVRRDGSIMDALVNSLVTTDPSGKKVNLMVMRDVTEKKIAEERYRNLVYGSPIPILVHSEGKVVFANQEAVRAFHGHTEKDLIGRSALDLVAPSSYTVAKDRIGQIYERESTVPLIEERLLRIDGRPFTAEVTATSVLHEGKPASQVVFRDITLRKQAEEALAIRLRYEEGLAACSHTLLAKTSGALDTALRHLLQASNACRVYIFENFEDPRDHLCCRQTHEVCAPGVSEQLNSPALQHVPYEEGLLRWQQELSNNRPIAGPVLTFPQSERAILRGQDILSLLVLPIWVRNVWWGIVGFDDTKEERHWNEEDVRLLRTAADMIAARVERDLSEQALLRSEARLRRVVDIVPHEICARNREGRYLLVNQALADHHAMTISQLTGKLHSELVADTDACRRTLDSDAAVLAAGRQVHEPEVQSITSDGTIRWLETYKSPFAMFDEDAVLICATDITARKQAEEERHRLEAQIQQARKFESLNIMAGSIAHNFNNLLMAVLGNLELVLAESSSSSSGRESIEDARDAAKRAAELSVLMLTYTGRRLVHREPVDLNQLLLGMKAALEEISGGKVPLNIRPGRDPLPCEGDPRQVRQVISNLVSNAVDAVETGGRPIDVLLGLQDCAPGSVQLPFLDEDLPGGQYVFIEVSDHGHGMDRDTLDRVFDPFFTTKFTGRGMGMATVLGIVRAHHGGLSIQSEVGRGTTVRVLLPHQPPIEQATATPAPSAAGASPGTAPFSGCLLLVDDEKMILDITGRLLKRLGFSVLEATDGREAVALFERHAHEIRCVLLDISMPHMNGEEVFSEIRRIRRDVPIIFSSGHPQEQFIQVFNDAEHLSFIQKPYEFAVLTETIRRALGPPDR